MVELMAVSPQNHPGKRKLEEIETITFDHVTFRYPNTTQDILKDVSFTVGKNEKISIVGLNGAGKTTIVKLICGLYEPSEGQLKINGIPLFEYDYASYIAKISTVFQDFKLFNYSISEISVRVFPKKKPKRFPFKSELPIRSLLCRIGGNRLFPNLMIQTVLN